MIAEIRRVTGFTGKPAAQAKAQIYRAIARRTGMPDTLANDYGKAVALARTPDTKNPYGKNTSTVIRQVEDIYSMVMRGTNPSASAPSVPMATKLVNLLTSMGIVPYRSVESAAPPPGPSVPVNKAQKPSQESGGFGLSETERSIPNTKTQQIPSFELRIEEKQIDDELHRKRVLAEKEIDVDRRKAQLEKNKAQGVYFEEFARAEIETEQKDVKSQITVKTHIGVRTRIDLVGKDKISDIIRLTELKSSETAPLTENQKKAFPEIKKTGAVVVGKGKPPYTHGYRIPPTEVEIIRPKTSRGRFNNAYRKE